MPFVPRLFLKTGIAYLGVTFVVGAVLLTLEALGHPAPFIVGIEHGHLGFVGWLVNTVVGVALWLLPLNKKAFPQTQGRYPESAARAAYAALNGGLLLRLVAEPLFSFAPTTVNAVLLIAAAVLQVGAIAVIARIAWLRVFAPPLRPNV